MRQIKIYCNIVERCTTIHTRVSISILTKTRGSFHKSLHLFFKKIFHEGDERQEEIVFCFLLIPQCTCIIKAIYLFQIVFKRDKTPLGTRTAVSIVFNNNNLFCFCCYMFMFPTRPSAV